MNFFRSLLKRLFRRGVSRLPQGSGGSAPPFIVINGVALTKEELDERVASYKTPLKQQRPAGRSLKLMGYWAPHEAGQPPWPDVRRAVRPGWRAADRGRLVAYLRNGHRCNGYPGFSSCRFDCRVTYSILGSGELTDGEWVWP
jgi:hypothetical protein